MRLGHGRILAPRGRRRPPVFSRGPAMPITTGTVLGRYRLLEKAGVGGMSEVWKAEDETLKRTVAVKVILGPVAAESTFRERFLREARLVAGLEHPNVLPVFDYGTRDDRRRRGVVPRHAARGRRLAQGPRRGARSARSRGHLAFGDRLGSRPRARQGHSPPRRQTGERPDGLAGPAASRRLRPRAQRRGLVGTHGDGHGARDAALHGARAGDRRGSQRPRGSVRARRDRVRAPGGTRAVLGAIASRGPSPARHGASAAALVGIAGHRSRCGCGARPRPLEGARRPVLFLRRFRRRARNGARRLRRRDDRAAGRGRASRRSGRSSPPRRSTPRRSRRRPRRRKGRRRRSRMRREAPRSSSPRCSSSAREGESICSFAPRRRKGKSRTDGGGGAHDERSGNGIVRSFFEGE